MPIFRQKNSADWKWRYEHVVKRLKILHKQGFMVCIFSNQCTIRSQLNGVAAKKIKNLISNVLKDTKIPAYVFISTQKDTYRKPDVEMWKWMEKNCLNDKADLNQSFYVGDAIGGPNSHSDSDKVFAKNVGVQFYDSDAFFRG